jgi:ABC-type transport system involved in multi-copper enzyme maturation permease subunit
MSSKKYPAFVGVVAFVAMIFGPTLIAAKVLSAFYGVTANIYVFFLWSPLISLTGCVPHLVARHIRRRGRPLVTVTAAWATLTIAIGAICLFGTDALIGSGSELRARPTHRAVEWLHDSGMGYSAGDAVHMLATVSVALLLFPPCLWLLERSSAFEVSE